MSKPDIGVDVDDLRLQVKDGLRKASDLGFDTVELATVRGDVEPSNLSSSGRRHLSHFVDGLGLRMAALVADMPGLRLTDPRTVNELIERTRWILELARDLKVPVVTASAGALTYPQAGDSEDDCSTASRSALDALKQLGEYADSQGVVYALRSGHGGGDRIACVLDELRCPSIQICLDPAASVIAGANPLSVIERLPRQIALMHMRDGTAGLPEQPGHETRLGEGDVDLVGVLATLSAADYAGPYILRRTDSPTPVADIREARDKLIRLLPAG